MHTMTRKRKPQTLIYLTQRNRDWLKRESIRTRSSMSDCANTLFTDVKSLRKELEAKSKELRDLKLEIKDSYGVNVK